MAPRVPEEWRVPVVFALLVTGGLVYSASHAWFWQRAHDTAWAAGPLILALLALLLWRRSRVAWWIFVVFGVLGLVSDLGYVSTSPGLGVGVRWAIGAVIGLAELGLLLSPQMRVFVRSRRRLA